MATVSVNGLVSIITPTYDTAQFLPATIRSVLNQTYKNWEWIIADDGSTDQTAGIMAELQQSDHRVRFIPADGHCGIAARVRNRALTYARGEFIAFLDADDTWHPEKLARQIAYLRQHANVDGVCCRYEPVGDPEAVNLTKKMMRWDNETICRRSDVIRGCPFQTSTVLFRRRCYDELGGMDEDPRLRATEDTEYFARLVARYNFHRITEPLSFYRVSSAHSSYTDTTRDMYNSRGWLLFEVMCEKGFYTPSEKRRKMGYLFYEQAKDNLFHVGGPFRRFLARSVFSGHPPAKAFPMLILSVLPAAMARWLLLEVGGLVWRWNTRNSGTANV
ncbi:MAG: glycosyltransferase [Candidatus Hydrogenedentes bacterium]|nr:glycosyltransferase [Candidatus Hydrogenedentota bacterium]